MLKNAAVMCGVILIVGSVVCAWPGAAAGAQPAPAKAVDPWLARTTKLQFQAQRSADAPLQLDLPKKDWMVLPSGGAVLLIFASRKGDAVVIVDHSPLRQTLEAADITDTFAQIEEEDIKKQQPKASDFQRKVLDAGERRLVAVQYTRTGVLGAERVRQYSVPVKNQLYRITCISTAALFVGYDPVFSHIAGSFSVTE